MSEEIEQTAPLEGAGPISAAAEEAGAGAGSAFDVKAAVNEAVGAAMAELFAKFDERLPMPEVASPEDPVVALEAANARVAELEASLAERSLEAAIRDNAEAAGVRAQAALDSAAVRSVLKSVDLSDSSAVIDALKGVAGENDYLKAVTHARVPKNSGDKPAGKPSGMTLDGFKKLDYDERVAFRRQSPDEFRALQRQLYAL